MIEEDPGKDAPDGGGERDDNLIHRLRRGGGGTLLRRRTEAVRLVVGNAKHQLIRFPRLDGLDVEVVDMVVDLGWDLGGHDEEAVGGEHEDSILRFVAALLQLHRRLQQDLKGLDQELRTSAVEDDL